MLESKLDAVSGVQLSHGMFMEVLCDHLGAEFSDCCKDVSSAVNYHYCGKLAQPTYNILSQSDSTQTNVLSNCASAQSQLLYLQPIIIICMQIYLMACF